MEEASYYAIIPAGIRYSDLPPNAKLMYGEITALSNKKGVCWASNSYFAQLYGVHPNVVSRWINVLKDREAINVFIDRDAGNKRYITINQKVDSYQLKGEDPYQLKGEDNNTSTNNKSISNPDTALQVRKIYALYLKWFKSDNKDNFNKEMFDVLSKRYRLTPKKQAAIERRLEDAGFDMLASAIVGYGNSPWHQGENNSGWTADLIKYICRSYEMVEQGAELYRQQNSNTNDPWANL